VKALLRTFFIFLALAPRLSALEFEGSAEPKAAPAAASQATAEATVPRLIDAGDVPTAYGLLKYELRGDVRFYPGGGILTKVNLGIFPRLMMGGALDVPGLVGAGPVTLVRENASLLVRVLALKEDERIPGLVLGWDGPAFSNAELRGLYFALSKELKTALGYFQLHGGMNSGANLDNNWRGDRDLRGFAALSTTFRVVSLFVEADEIGNLAGLRLNAGLRAFFDPISLGVEFRDLGATRSNVPSSRLLRVSYTGLF
jgi:hypothetical protein